jgi:signal transduction histidine kinase
MGNFVSRAMSLRGRLVMLVCLATLPAILFAFYIADNERSAAFERMEEDSRHIVSLISREHFYQIAGAKQLLHWLAGRPATVTNNSDLLSDSSLLPALLAGYPQLANIAVLTPEGDVISSAYPLSGPINMHDYDAIRRALQSHDIEVGVYTMGPIVKRPLLHLAYAVRSATGAVRQVVFVAIDLDWLGRLMGLVELPTEHNLLIADRNGRVLASSARPSSAAVAVGRQIPELAETARGQENMITARIDGLVQPFAVAPMEGLPGVLIASGLPYGPIYQKANRIFYRAIGGLSLLTLLTVLSVMLFEEVALIRYLRGLSLAMYRFGKGDFSARAPVSLGKGELQDMARTFNDMATGLAARHRDLEEAHHRLDLLARHLQVARESEAQRISRDLHDEAGQVLTSLKMDLADLQKKCRQCSQSPVRGNTIEADTDVMKGKIDHMIAFIRRLSSALRPPVLDKMGLAAAMELLVAEVEKNSELAVELELTEMSRPLEWLVSTTLYRIAQEALTNIVRHAEASLAHIDLRSGDKGVTLVIRDNGKGFAVQADHGLGIIGMRERANLVGGSFSIESIADSGTVIIVTIPYASGVHDQDIPG